MCSITPFIIGQDVGYPKSWEYRISLSLPLGWYQQNNHVCKISIRMIYPDLTASGTSCYFQDNEQNLTAHLPIPRSKTGNAAIPGLSCCSREVDVVTRIEILHSLQEQHNTTIKTLSEQQFLVTPGHKGSFKINRKKNPGARVCKAVQKERTCQCFHDSVI